MNLERCRWLALACLMLSTAHADDTNKHSATLSVQGDEDDNRQWLGRLALPMGDYAWAQASIGRSEFAAAGANNMKIVGAALGAGGQTVSAGVEFVQRKDGERYEQQSWAGTLDWRGARGGLGADVVLRSANGESTTTQPGTVFVPAVTTRIKESADGKGYGLHGHFALTPQFTVFAGAMRYEYDFDVRSTTTSTSTPLSSLLGTNSVLSGAWRDQAFVDSSYRVGGTYRMQAAALSAQYFRDRAANTDATLSTVQLQAEFPIAEHWLLSPTLGYSDGGDAGNVGYGGMSLSFYW